MVVASLVWFVAAGPEADTAPWWIALYADTLAPGWGRAAHHRPLAALGPARAALIAVTLFALWSLYWAVRELVDPQLGLEQSVLRAHIVGVVLTVLACFVAQAGPARVPAAGPSDQ